VLQNRKDQAFQRLRKIIETYFSTLVTADHSAPPLFELLKFGSNYLKTDDNQSDIDAILCSRVYTNVEGKRVQLLDHDNATFFGDFFGFLKKQTEVKDLLKI
jgi:hypothetical protein